MNSQSTDDDAFKAMNRYQRTLVDRLFEQPFPGCAELVAQTRNCLVRSIDENGSLDFMVTVSDRASVHSPVPVEAEVEDKDGVTIHMLLHVIDGIARGIEVYKEDGSSVIQFPQPAELRLFSPP